MLIKNIKKLNKGKYKVTIDDKDLILYEDILIKYSILKKKNIDDKLIREIEKENEFLEIYESALRYLNIKMRLENELIKYLKNKFDSKNIDKVITRLKKEGYINDSNYVESYINDKINLSSDGPYKIKRDLINKGIDENLINIDIDKDILIDKLNKIILKYSNLHKNNSLNVIRTKVLNHFNNLGYDRELIIEVFDNLDIKGNSEKINKEYEKLTTKYSKKYSGYKLENTIKQKLYQKGYSIDEINKIKKGA